MRSFPEKTFEHWCSIHLNYRYRSHLQMWWPSSGADINAAGGPLAPGKRVWLELKTTEWDPTTSRHTLTLDLAQLHAYGLHRIPDYYVFPIPPWDGLLGDPVSQAWLAGLDRTQLAYQTRSGLQWFAEWTYVIPGDDLRAWLHTAGIPPTQQTFKLGTVDNGTWNWSAKLDPDAEMIAWRDFWERLQTCGGDVLDAQFVLPAGALGSRQSAPYADVVQAIRDFKNATKSKTGPSSRDANRQSLELWTRLDDLFVREKPDMRLPADKFIWSGIDERSMVLLGADELRP